MKNYVEVFSFYFSGNKLYLHLIHNNIIISHYFDSVKSFNGKVLIDKIARSIHSKFLNRKSMKTYNIAFLRKDNNSDEAILDETQFDVSKGNEINELFELFYDFIDENKYKLLSIERIYEVPYVYTE